jgi:glycosyltransferase involved in cell wall biosynthesis
VVILTYNRAHLISRAIQSVLNNPEKAEEMGLEARQKCIEKYSWDAMEKILLKIFEKYC